MGQTARHPEEEGIDQGAGYLKRLEKLGPRKSESQISFVMRMGAIQAGRKLWISMANKFDGDLALICRKVGIKRSDTTRYLARVGLHARHIRSFARGDAAQARIAAVLWKSCVEGE